VTESIDLPEQTGEIPATESIDRSSGADSRDSSDAIDRASRLEIPATEPIHQNRLEIPGTELIDSSRLEIPMTEPIDLADWRFQGQNRSIFRSGIQGGLKTETKPDESRESRIRYQQEQEQEPESGTITACRACHGTCTAKPRGSTRRSCGGPAGPRREPACTACTARTWFHTSAASILGPSRIRPPQPSPKQINNPNR
jgi:hypothetical protein